MGAILGKKKMDDATTREARTREAWTRDTRDTRDARDGNIRSNTIKLCWACADGNLVEVEDILANKEVDINGDYARLSSLRPWRGIGATPLISAVTTGNNPEIVRRLLEHPGLDVGKKGVAGETGLYWACFLNRVSIVKLLCQDSRCSPSEINRKDSYGYTALMIAVERGNLDIVKELDKEGTDFRVKDRLGRTLIEIARKNNNDEMLEYLIDRNKQVDSLKVIAACNVASYVKNKADVEDLKMEIPETLRHYLAGFVANEDDQDTHDDR